MEINFFAVNNKLEFAEIYFKFEKNAIRVV